MIIVNSKMHIISQIKGQLYEICVLSRRLCKYLLSFHRLSNHIF